jgi:hypothetical protein
VRAAALPGIMGPLGLGFPTRSGWRSRSPRRLS